MKDEKKIMIAILQELSKKYEIVSRYGRWNRRKKCWE